MFTPDESVQKLREQFVTENIHGLALDIDETLSYTNGTYFSELFEKFGNPEELSLEDAITKYKITHSVPYWQTDEIKAHLIEMRRSEKTQAAIVPMPGSQEAIEEIAKDVHCACYITARPESMRAVTQQWLKSHGFPQAPLIMRPESVDDEHITIWKGPILEYLYPYVTGIIDNDPSFVKTISKDYTGVFFLYGPIAPPADNHIRTFICPHWHDVITAVQRYAQET